MSLTTRSNVFKSFSFRLTLWYAAFFIVSLIIIFCISYKILLTDLLHVVDRSLLAQTSKIDEEINRVDLAKVKSDIRESIEQEGKNRIFYRLLDNRLNIVETSDPLRWPCLNFPQLSQWAYKAIGNNFEYHTLQPPDRNFKIRIISRGIGHGQYVIQIGKTMQDEQELAGVYIKVFTGAVLVLLICAVFLAWLEAQKAMVRIEALMQGLKDVTNNIAHDLRTPITRIRGLAETSLGFNKNIDPESIGIIVEECDRLVVMINTMLEIAEADAGLKKLLKEPVDIVNMVRQGFELFEPVAQDKGIALEIKIPHESLIVVAEPSRLQRVISNLLDNAIKFTPSNGSITIEVKKEGSKALIVVQDTGIGIAEDQQDRIFEKFYRVESSRSVEGNGLGLSYVQSIVTSLGGTVSVESILGKGSRFIIKLPLVASSKITKM